MKLTIKTNTLRDLLNKSIKGASNNKMLPLTCMMCIEVTNNNLVLTTTDGNNYLYVFQLLENTDDFYAVVNADSFAKLVFKTTVDVMTFEVVDKCHLNVTGNGNYVIDIQVDENGEPLKFPNPLNNVVPNVVTSVSKASLDLILKTNKVSLATSLAEPCYTGYYMCNNVITSDRTVICCNDLKIFDTPKLINPELMNMLSVFDSDVEITVTPNNEIIFKGLHCTAYGHLMSEIDDFNAEAITELANKELPSVCHVNRDVLLETLDRLSLFIGPYDKNAVVVSFSANNHCMELRSLNTTAHEIIPVADNTVDMTCTIDIELLKKHLNVLSGITVEIQYGNDVFIKLIDGDTLQMIPLLVE